MNGLFVFLNERQKENIKSFPSNSRLKTPLIEQYIKKNIEKEYGYKSPIIGKGIMYNLFLKMISFLMIWAI